MDGDFPESFHDVVRAAVAGKRVLDLGCGDLERARQLQRLGARCVLAMDKKIAQTSHDTSLVLLQTSFASELARWVTSGFAAQVAHLAWPINHQTYVRDLLHQVPCVIYIGSNTGGNACGTPNLFNDLRYRPVEVYRPTRRNTLIIYGPAGLMPRTSLYDEEIAGLENTRTDQFTSYNHELAPRAWTKRA